MKKVALNSFGRFHTFDLAKKLNQFGILKIFVTSYPKHKFKIDNVVSYHYPNFQYILTALNRLKIYNFSRVYEKKIINNYSSKSALINYESVDIIHSLSSFGLETFKKYKNNKLLYIDRGSTHRNYQENKIKEEYYNYGIKYYPNHEMIERDIEEYEMADKIIVPSNFVKDTFILENISENKIEVIPYAMDSKLFFRYNPYKKKKKFLYVGALSIRKGIYYLLEAFNNLPDYALTVIGSQTDEWKLIKKKLGRINSNISIKGIIKRTELIKYFNTHDALILPSIEEGLPLVMLQAIMCKTPIIVSKECGHSTLGNLPNVTIIERSQESIINAVLNFNHNHYNNDYEKIINYIDINEKMYDQRIINLYK